MGFMTMSEVYNNDASTSLAASIGSSDVSISVVSSQQFNTSGTFRIRIDDEIMTVTAVSGTTWTVTRASEICEGAQVAVFHARNAAVYGVLTAASIIAGFSGGAGTVTTVSVVSANGVSGSVANPTTTPALTITLGAITPTTVSSTGNIQAGGNLGAVGNVSGSNLSGTNTGDQTITLTGDVAGSGSGSFAATIGAHVVSYAKMQQVSATSLLGNPTGSLGNVAEITLGTNLSLAGNVLNASGGTGTVSSINVTGGTTGLSTSGGPVTTSGTIVIAGILNPASGGLGADTSGYTVGQIPVAQGGGVYTADSRRGFYSGTGTRLVG